MIQTDTLLNGHKILQDPEQFMFGIDAVLLSDFAKREIHKKNTLCDLCTGTGIIPLLLEKNLEGENCIKALEIQEASAKMAAESVRLNGLENKIHIIQGDVKAVPEGKVSNEKTEPTTDFNATMDFNAAAKAEPAIAAALSTGSPLKKHSFDCVTCNPPYMINQHGKQNTLDAKTIARHEVLCNLEDIIKAVDYLLKPHGKLFMIHRPFRLPEIFNLLKKYNLEPKRMELIQPFEGTEPNMVLIEARKDANPRLKIEPNLTVYDKPGVYTKEIQEIYASITK